MIFNVNFIPLIIGMVLNMGLGALWYSSVLFAKPWMKEAHITEDDINNTDGMGKVYGMTALTALITSYSIGFIVVNTGVASILQAIPLAIIIWLGTDLSSIIKNWGFEKRTMKLGIINHGYDLVVYILIATLFTLF